MHRKMTSSRQSIKNWSSTISPRPGAPSVLLTRCRTTSPSVRDEERHQSELRSTLRPSPESNLHAIALPNYRSATRCLRS